MILCLVASIALHSGENVSQQIERVDDPIVVPSGISASLKIDRIWRKVNGVWIKTVDDEIPYFATTTNIDGHYFKSRNLFLKITATGFRFGQKKLAALSILSYSDFARPPKKGWVLNGPTVSLLVICLSGPISAPPSDWNRAEEWNLPSVGTWIAEQASFGDYVRAASYNPLYAMDRYVAKSVPSKWSTLPGDGAAPVVWGVFPATPKSGPVIRLLFPIESNPEARAEAGQSWEKLYIEVSPKKWQAFSDQLRQMLT